MWSSLCHHPAKVCPTTDRFFSTPATGHTQDLFSTAFISEFFSQNLTFFVGIHVINIIYNNKTFSSASKRRCVFLFCRAVEPMGKVHPAKSDVTWIKAQVNGTQGNETPGNCLLVCHRDDNGAEETITRSPSGCTHNWMGACIEHK